MRRLLARRPLRHCTTPSSPTLSTTHLCCRCRCRCFRNRHYGRPFSQARVAAQRSDDARVRQIEDDYASIRDHYATPRYPIVLAHGLLGFSQLQVLPRVLPTIHYWHGIHEALAALEGARVITSVASVTTVSTPHRGSPFADHVLAREAAGWMYLPRLYRALERAGLGTEAFAQLTTGHMRDFNQKVPDVPGVRYFSYGAVMDEPPLLSPFRIPKRIIDAREGQNDGLVSVESSKWGVYQGTLVGVNHLDLINWPNKVRWMVKGWLGIEKRFNAVAFYLGIADMLAREGL
ncbi:hypothetical protein AAL_06860 [Moelleriella libera RCEF 2490]|uniref:Triacylglycerol lipase n=1 Tax=Moelleriella libera RCEF 2490 TaxID=1081109 RepID=A0A167YBS1_9HYPO|nr:hypothetical protein AAL_06860 [Moelleriella libera RCEF 2490]